MKCYECDNQDENLFEKLEGPYHYRCLVCNCEVEGTCITYSNGDWFFDDWLGDAFEVGNNPK